MVKKNPLITLPRYFTAKNVPKYLYFLDTDMLRDAQKLPYFSDWF